MYMYTEILETDNDKQAKMKEKTKKEYFRQTRKLLDTKLCSINLIKEISNWAVPLVRYSRPFFERMRKKLQQMDQQTRKPMTIHKALHPRDDIDGLYVSRKEGERGLAALKIASMHQYEDSNTIKKIVKKDVLQRHVESAIYCV